MGFKEGAGTTQGPGKQRQIRVAPALGKPLLNALAHPPPVTGSQNGKDFWSNSREERGVGGGGAGMNLTGGLQKASSGAGSKAGSGASARKFPSWSIYMPHT